MPIFFYILLLFPSPRVLLSSSPAICSGRFDLLYTVQASNKAVLENTCILVRFTDNIHYTSVVDPNQGFGASALQFIRTYSLLTVLCLGGWELIHGLQHWSHRGPGPPPQLPAQLHHQGPKTNISI